MTDPAVRSTSTEREGIGTSVEAETLLLRLAAAHTFMTAGQADLLLGRHDTNADTLLTELVQAGTIAQTVGLRHHRTFAITRAGFDRSRSALELPSRPDPRQYWDEFGAEYMRAAAHRGALGDKVTAVYSRREMREHDRSTQPLTTTELQAVSAGVRERLTDTRFAIHLVGENSGVH